jgi:cytochrome c nitrite reductase small subunit
METKSTMKFVSVFSVVATLGMFGYLVHTSKAFSYFSEDPKVCINCHTMNTEYATWQHSSHRERATCVECHLPQESLADKLMAKSRDGFKHSVAMTFRTYVGNNIRISESARQRIQSNCIYCHHEIVSQMLDNSRLYMTTASHEQFDRKCWSCHRNVPHGRARSLTSTPDSIGVKEI